MDPLTSLVIALVAGLAAGLEPTVVQGIDESVHIRGEYSWNLHR
ncbi:MAG TPA: hypothetical protein VLK82_09405 [Candidatus Tectomicrobia bacterium]|nr:hypothetical protein [Candidatus Tectomicrobia bacterium]